MRLIYQMGMVSTSVLDALHISIPSYKKKSWIIVLKSLSLFLSVVFDWSRLQELFSAIWFGRYCPYWRECVRVLGVYICTSLWLIIILCQHNVSDWEEFTPSEMIVVFSWGRNVIACGVWVYRDDIIFNIYEYKWIILVWDIRF